MAAILDAAAGILEQQGYRAASTNAIARRAGVSVGSLYQYFASREDVFCALLKRHHDAIHPLVEAAQERIAHEGTRPSEVLADLLQELLHVHAGRPRLMEAMETELQQALDPSRQPQEPDDVETATRGLASRIPGPPAQAMARAWLAAEITAMVSRRLAHRPPTWVEVEEVQAAYLRAMRCLVG